MVSDDVFDRIIALHDASDEILHECIENKKKGNVDSFRDDCERLFDIELAIYKQRISLSRQLAKKNVKNN